MSRRMKLAIDGGCSCGRSSLVFDLMNIVYAGLDDLQNGKYPPDSIIRCGALDRDHSSAFEKIERGINTVIERWENQ